MTDETSAPAGGEAVSAPAIDSDEISLTEARAMIDAAFQENPDLDLTDESVKPKKPAPAEPESSQEESDPETDPAEVPEDAEPDETPPIERPRSWTKDEDAEWQSLPRAMQQKIVAREQERDTGLRRSQNEAAEDRKAAKAERDMAEKARQQYEAQLPALMQQLQNVNQANFSDIKTTEDMQKLANEDPFRYLQWDAHQKQLVATKIDLDRAQGQQTQKQQADWNELVQKENALAAEFIPDLADKDKAEKLTSRVAKELLPDLGFTQSELADLASGKKQLPLYDHRIQRLFADSLKLRDIQKAPKAVAAKALPPVQRPGVARAPGSSDSEAIQALEKRFNQSGSEKDAWALLEARERASSRRRAS